LRSTVIAHPIDRRVVNHRAIVDIRNAGVADVSDDAVVVEVVTMPVTALVTRSHIAESIVDTAIKSNIPAPIAMIETISPSAKTPVSRSPESSLVRRCSPGSWYPIIAVRSIAPVSRSPKITRFRNRRLFIFR
jgi:hypothetical protein